VPKYNRLLAYTGGFLFCITSSGRMVHMGQEEDPEEVIRRLGDSIDWSKVAPALEPKPPLFSPHTPYFKQKVFLLTPQLEVLYGGRAGGGKSDALLMAALQYVDVPGYSAILFRNSFSDLVLPGALMDRAREWFEPMMPELKWRAKTTSWQFPAGSTITFGYLDKPDDHLRYKGAEFQFVGFDEVTEIREKHYQYLFSRLRKPSEGPLSKVPLRARAASNPAPNWVRERFIENPVDEDGNQRIYIPAGLDDNPFLDKKSYQKSLAKLDPTERARLERGDWYAEEEGAKFQRDWFKIINPDEIPDAAYNNIVRYWDIASTLPSEANKDPDWTAGALVSEVDGVMIVHDMRRDRRNAGGVEDLIYQTAHEDGPAVKIRMEQEPGASGKITIDHFGRNILPGFDFDGHPAVRNKEARVDAWAGHARRGHVLLVRPQGHNWIPAFMDEATSFGAVTSSHDDQLDAISGAYEVLFNMGSKKRRKVRIIV
jgi:predicted phage terminase large subunit-like protein